MPCPKPCSTLLRPHEPYHASHPLPKSPYTTLTYATIIPIYRPIHRPTHLPTCRLAYQSRIVSLNGGHRRGLGAAHLSRNSFRGEVRPLPIRNFCHPKTKFRYPQNEISATPKRNLGPPQNEIPADPKRNLALPKTKFGLCWSLGSNEILNEKPKRNFGTPKTKFRHPQNEISAIPKRNSLKAKVH